MTAKTIIDASGVSPDVLIWLKKDQKGYFIERLPNMEHAMWDIFRINESDAEKSPRDPEKAWFAMERLVGAAPI